MIRLTLLLLALSCVTATAAQPQSTAAAKPAATAKTASPVPQGTPININTASAAELETLPGIGAKTAARILEYRQKNGPFKKIEDLMNVRGLGEKNFLKLKAQLTVAAPKVSER